MSEQLALAIEPEEPIEAAAAVAPAHSVFEKPTGTSSPPTNVCTGISPKTSRNDLERGPEAGGAVTSADQLALVEDGGRRTATGLQSEQWQRLLDHQPTRRRYAAKTYQRALDECWFWTGAISSSGHGKMRAGAGAATVVTAHVYGYQLAAGLITARPGQDPVVAHRCDEASCQNPRHWELIERSANGADYRTRRYRATGPLADVRGTAGRATAIRAAILDAQATGVDVEAAITAAMAAGLTRATGLF